MASRTDGAAPSRAARSRAALAYAAFACAAFALGPAACSDAPAARVRPTAAAAVRPAAVAIVRGHRLSPNVSCLAPDCRAYSVRPYVLATSRYGTTCLGTVPPGTEPDARRPPESFAAADAFRPGFPRRLTRGERDVLERIERERGSRGLRIAWIDGATTPHGFIVFDAVGDVCSTSLPYAVLNGTCTENYEPGENPYDTMAAPDCWPSDRRWKQREL